MKCPQCNKGDIRVHDLFLFISGHPVFCDRCFAFFHGTGRSDGLPRLPLQFDQKTTERLGYLKNNIQFILSKFPLM